MNSEPSVHDNFIYEYNVNCEKRTLTIHTVFRDCDPHEFTDITFHDVVAHHFDHVLEKNILFDVEEVELAALVLENTALFTSSWRYGWPSIEYGGNLEELIHVLQNSGTRAYEISSSYGMSGWVMAGSCARLTRCTDRHRLNR